ncbi:OmpA family protein [Fusibacter sp. JL216-2]|uniref:OmpA family protein n=1 Tax=Fusibacter sp. JL216-2 TaxID=3071453 RepID=UPI003D334247
MKMKYRVTPRGKVVFTVAGIIILISLFGLIQSLIPDQNSQETEGKTQAVQDDITQDDQMDMGSNIEEESSQVDQAEEVGNNDLKTLDDSQVDENESIDTSLQADNCRYGEDGSAGNESEASGYSDTELERLYNAKSTVYFEPDKYDLQDEYKLVLNIFIGAAKDFPNEKIKVEGNINGYPKFNDTKFGEELSQIRANKVAQYMMNLGIPENRIIVLSNGSSKPLNKSDDAEELKLNRRTDVYFENYLIEDEDLKK